MKHTHSIKLSLVALAALILTSCGVQIQFESIVPAKTNLGRGTMIACEPDGNRAACKIAYAIANRINQDGYYTVGSYNNGGRMAFLEVMNAQTKTTRSGKYSYTDLSATIRISDTHDRQLYRRSLETDVDEDQYGNLYLDDACRDIAKAVMLDLTPHTVTYRESVSPDENNPSIELGANACAAGNWAQGREYAKQALATNPSSAEAYYLLGLIERHARNYAQSTAYFQKAYSLENNSKYQSGISKNAELQQNEQYAKQQLRK